MNEKKPMTRDKALAEYLKVFNPVWAECHHKMTLLQEYYRNKKTKEATKR